MSFLFPKVAPISAGQVRIASLLDRTMSHLLSVTAAAIVTWAIVAATALEVNQKALFEYAIFWNTFGAAFFAIAMVYLVFALYDTYARKR